MAPIAYSYPYPEDDLEIKTLMEMLEKLRKKEEEIKVKLRQLIYKIEKPR